MIIGLSDKLLSRCNTDMNQNEALTEKSGSLVRVTAALNMNYCSLFLFSNKTNTIIEKARDRLT